MTDLIITVLLAARLITLPMALEEMAVREGVDPALAACIVERESSWQTDLVSKDGDTGLFQIIPSTARWTAEQMHVGDYDLTEPVTNMRMGLWILARWPEWYSTLPYCEELDNEIPRW